MISFIIPVYNAAAYLPACLDSLLHQTETDLQIILVDDGSTDGSLVAYEAMQREGTLDARIELYHQSHAGQSAARNLGMRHAKGEYIAFVDADDRLQRDWCARHLEAIEGVDYVQSGYRRMDTPHIPGHSYQFTSPCMRLYRRAALEGMLFTEGMIYEDVIWSVDLWLRGLRCRRIDYAGYLYTLNPDSTTSRRHPEAEKRVFEELRQRRKKLSIFDYRLSIINYTILRLKLHFIRQ